MEQHELEALLNPSTIPKLKCSVLHSQQLPSAEFASFHGDHVDCPVGHPIPNPNARLYAASVSFHGDYIERNFHSLNPNWSSVSETLCESLPPSSFLSDHNGVSSNPRFDGASGGHLNRGLSEALPASVLGELRGVGQLQKMPASFHGDNEAGTGDDHDVFHGRIASKPENFYGEQKASAGPRETQVRQVLVSFHGDLEGAASSDHRRPLPASKIVKAASVRDASRAEILRRKKISQLFSKLEVLLPQEDVLKYDRCSLIDATIHYIASLEERMAKKLRKGGIMKIESVVVGQKMEDSCKKRQLNESLIHCGSPKQLEEYWKKEELGARMISISSARNENVFINVVTPHLDPLLFTSLFTVLHHHNLQIITASLTRMDKMVHFSFSTKISLSKHEYNKKSLEDAISEALKDA